MKNPLKTLIDNPDNRKKRFEKVAKEIDALSDVMMGYTDEQLQNKTKEFKERYANGETLDDLKVEAFAVAREADRRILGLHPFYVQIVGSLVLHDGNIAEMKTGEGKTLTATMAVYLNAIAGKGVHVITVNDYLSKRDKEQLAPMYEWLGLTVGLAVGEDLTQEEKKEAYDADITFTTNSAIGFDYLKDNIVTSKDDVVMREVDFAIIDEVDSILIDFARTPLIISGSPSPISTLYARADRFAKMLVEGQDYKVDDETRTTFLTNSGIDKAEKFFNIKNLYNHENTAQTHHIDQALRANFNFEKDRDYIVQDDEVQLIDSSTGRIQENSRLSDGLHQALEAKEGVEIQDENRSMAQITYQNFFRMYKKLAGMTGTALTEEEEIGEIYNMSVVPVPTNMPNKRKDLPDILYPSIRAKFKAVVDLITELHNKKQPILVGTASVENSELLSKMLMAKNIPHNVLNAVNVVKEAEIISNAGQMGAVTVATNMAGRGTDIKLGPGVEEIGGLFVIGTERHESRRVDNQLRGRSGRQGEKGFSQFFLSLEDDLMVRFGAEKIKNMLKSLNFDDETPITNRFINKSVENAQKRVEGNNYDQRKNVLQYDDVMRQQRELMYGQRTDVLFNRVDLTSLIKTVISESIENNVNEILENRNDETFDQLMVYINNNLLSEGTVSLRTVKSLSNKDIIELLNKKSQARFEETLGKIDTPENVVSFEQFVLLRSVDTYWIDHISDLERLRQSTTMRSYGQLNPLIEYQDEAFSTFNNMVNNIKSDATTYALKTEVRPSQNIFKKNKEKDTAEDIVVLGEEHINEENPELKNDKERKSNSELKIKKNKK